MSFTSKVIADKINNESSIKQDIVRGIDAGQFFYLENDLINPVIINHNNVFVNGKYNRNNDNKELNDVIDVILYILKEKLLIGISKEFPCKSIRFTITSANDQLWMSQTLFPSDSKFISIPLRTYSNIKGNSTYITRKMTQYPSSHIELSNRIKNNEIIGITGIQKEKQDFLTFVCSIKDNFIRLYVHLIDSNITSQVDLDLKGLSLNDILEK